MERINNSDDNIKSKYNINLDKLIGIYSKIQDIMLISLNDIFRKNNLPSLINNEYIKDTIILFKQYNYSISKINETIDFSNLDNKIVYQSNEQNEIFNNSTLITKFQQEINNSHEEKKKIIFNKKKSYEVMVLSEYMNSLITNEGIFNLIEMGCGKSYLNDYILNNDKIVYIGIDKKDDLIEKMNKKN